MNIAKRVLTLSFVLSCFLGCQILLSHVALAQFNTSEGIIGTGDASVEGRADVMRMSITVEAKGVDFKAAVKAIAAKKKKAMIQLEKLGAIEDSIKIEEADSDGDGDSAQMMERMMRQMGNDPRMAKMLKVKPPISMKAKLSAEWKVEGEDDELLIACDELKTKITEADVAQTKDKIELSPEQEELAEEMAEAMNSYGGRVTEKPGTPTFYFVKKISAEDHDKLVGEAFEQAKSKAQRLAKATNLELGKLKSCVSRNDIASVMSEMYGSYGYGSRSSIPTGGATEDGGFEAIGSSPANIVHKVSIALMYEIKE